jgi:hypothetical protein
MRQTRKADLFKALPIVAASLGRKFGVKVMFQGSTAMTDGKSIILPTLTEDSQHVEALWGYLAHEAAHIRFTDFDLLREQGKRNALEKNIHNIFEDGVIEREIMKVFPGTASSLMDTCQHLIDLKLWMDADDYDVKGEPTPPEHTLSGYILFRIRCDAGLSDQADLLQGYLDRFRARFKDTFGQDVLSGLDDILDRAHLNADTRDALAMTQEVMDYLELSTEGNDDGDSGDDQQSSSQSGEGESGGTSQSDDDLDDEQSSQGGDSDDGNDSDSSDSQGGDDSSDDSGDEESGDDTESPGNGSNGDDADSESSIQSSSAGADDDQGSNETSSNSGDGSDSSEKDSSSSEGVDSSTGQDGTSSEQRVSLRDALASIDEDAMAGDVLKPLAEAMEQEALEKASNSVGMSEQTSQVAASFGVSPDEAVDYASEGGALDFEARRVTRKLRQQLTGLVQASRTARPYSTRRGRKLNASRLSRLKTGDTRVFVREDTTQEPETAIHLLVDRSSSMSGIKAEMAGQATYALAIALQTIEGVQVSASSFGGSPIQYPNQLVTENPVKTILSPSQVARRMPGRFVIQPEGLTPLAPGVWSALDAFRQVSAERSVLIVLTDGGASDYVAASSVIDRARRHGVEVYGIGIQALANPELFDDSVLITELSQLGAELFRLARKHLIAA